MTESENRELTIKAAFNLGIKKMFNILLDKQIDIEILHHIAIERERLEINHFEFDNEFDKLKNELHN